MQAIILAAGMGKRLGEYTHDNTKCMLEVNGVKLIDRALACLHDVGVSRIVLVIGYKGFNFSKCAWKALQPLRGCEDSACA